MGDKSNPCPCSVFVLDHEHVVLNSPLRTAMILFQERF